MVDGPDLPIFLSTFKDQWEKIERLQTKLSGKSYTHIEPPKKGYGDKEKQLWDHEYRKRNPEAYQYQQEISDWQKMIAERENNAIRTALESGGVEFTNGDQLGVKLR